MAESLKTRIQEDVKTAMRAKDKPRLGTLRLLTAAIKQTEIDGQSALDDAGVVTVIEKMIKQRRDAEQQFRAAERTDLADQEAFEIEVISAYMPEALSEAAVDQAVDAAIGELGASSIKDMGKVMQTLKGHLQGRANMGEVSAKVKQRLS
jgi:uncharacterized protein YqeY